MHINLVLGKVTQKRHRLNNMFARNLSLADADPTTASLLDREIVRMLENVDPTGATRLRRWIDGLRSLTPATEAASEFIRMIHPGLRPADGNGLVAASPQSLLLVPGEDASAVTLLHFIRAQDPDDAFDTHGRAAMLGALLTLVTDRRCQVAPEIFARVEGQENTFAIPVTGQIDSVLGAPMPSWTDTDSLFRNAVARMTSLPEDQMEALSAAIHLHYCACMLMTRDLAGAYALTVGGIECLSRRFGNPPTDWHDWDRAPSWEKFFAKQAFTEAQAQALRVRLMKDEHIKLAETFATYATDRLPEGFWEEPVQSYTWGVDAGTTMPIEGSWSEPRPRGPEFANDPVKTKIAFKLAYRQRSQFLHAGERTVNFVRDAFSEAGALQETEGVETGGKPYLSMAQLRAALRSLILRELADNGDPDPKGLDEIIFMTTPTPPAHDKSDSSSEG